MPKTKKQNVTVSLGVQTVHKAKAIAAKRSTSISALVTEQIESLVDKDEADQAYERAAAAAIALMQKGFDMGGGPRVSREELHER